MKLKDVIKKFVLILLTILFLINSQPLWAENLHLASQLEENKAIQSAATLERPDSSRNKDRNLYFSFSGMGVWVGNDSLSASELSGDGGNSPTSLSVEINAGNLKLKERGGGYGATAAVGKKLGKGFRSEIEFAYRSGGYEDLTIRKFSTKNDVDIAFVNAHYSTRSLLANLIWDIPLTERFSPYIGGGVGLVWTSVSEGAIENGKSGLAWQLMTGLSYRATDRMEIFGGYRYFVTETQVRVWDHVLVDVDTHSVEVGVRYYLDSAEKDSSTFGFKSQDNPFYIGVSGGLIQQQDMGVRMNDVGFNEGINTQSYKFKAGYGLELALGYKFCSFCRVELEYSYKYSKIASVIDRAPPDIDLVSLNPVEDSIVGISSRSIIHALLVNLYADLDIGDIKKKYRILPFVGIGLGGMYIDFKNNRFDPGAFNVGSLHIAKARWAAQMTAGVGYSLTEQVTTGVQYKYLAMLGSSDLFGEPDQGNGASADQGGKTSFANNIRISSYSLFARYNF